MLLSDSVPRVLLLARFRSQKKTLTRPAYIHPFCSMSGPGQFSRRPTKLVLIGDVHHHWNEQDAAALKFLKPDIALFVGDFGEEMVQLVADIKRQVDAYDIPAAYILGNHDAWHSLHKKQLLGIGDPLLAGAQAQLSILGHDHIGYNSKQFSELGISIVGARPFSAGGASWARAAKFQHIMFGIGSMQASADKVFQTIQEQPKEHVVVVMAHNGPTGLGAQQHDICGKDWSDKPGDHGDPDLASALQQTAEQGRPVPLVVFGHMHHMLKGGQRRRSMVHIDQNSGTVFLNCAVVPRLGSVHPADDSIDPLLLSQFTVVNMAAEGYVQSASYVWVGMRDNQCHTVSDEALIQTDEYSEIQLSRRYLVTGHALTDTSNSPSWESVVSTHHQKNAIINCQI